jgi:diguanylate cyclase (GGDEF)-like protein
MGGRWGGWVIALVGGVLGTAILLGAGDAVMPVAALVTAIVMATSLRRRGIAGQPPWPWFQGALVGATVGWLLLASGWGFEPTHPATVAGMLVFLASYLVMAGCIIRISRARLGAAHGDVWIDGSVFAVATGAVFANLFLGPTEGLAVTTTSVVVFLVIPLVMAFALAGALRLLLAGGHRIPSVWLLVGAGGAFLLTDIAYLHADAALGDATLMGWLAAFLLFAGAMAHPSVAELTTPAGADWAPSPVGRFAASGLALTAVGAILIRNAATLGIGTALAASAALALVLWRLLRLFVERERHLVALREGRLHEQALLAVSRSAVTAGSMAEFLDDLAHHVELATRGRAVVRSADDDQPMDGEVYRLGTSAHVIRVAPEGSSAPAHDRTFVTAVANIASAAVERRQSADRLRYESLHDPLTGLANRQLVYDRLEHAIASRERHGGGLGIVYLDLDGFKVVNDRLGHAAGDAVLVEVAARLREITRAVDTVGRLGGDEFIVVCPAVDHAVAVRIAERAVARLTEPYEVAGERVSVGVSVGLAVHESAATADELLDATDAAMYEAKRSGGSRFTEAKAVALEP